MKSPKPHPRLIFYIILIILFVSVGIFLIGFEGIDNQMEEEKPQFQGPVPEGYDEEYFRKTGITKLLEEENGI